MDDGLFEGPAWSYRSETLRALGLRFSVRSTSRDLGVTLDRLLGSLVDGTPGPVAIEYGLVETGPSGGSCFAVSAGDDRVGVAATAHAAVTMLLWDVNDRAVASTTEHLLLHAAALARHGAGIVLPGPSGAGKTTLSAGLARSGMTYLTDEVTAIDPVTRELAPYPRPLTVEQGAWAVLAELGLWDGGGYTDGPTRHLAPSRLRGAGAEEAAGVAGVWERYRPRFIVVHRYLPGAETRLVPLRGSAALVALAESSFQPLHRRPGGLEALAEVVRGCECLELQVGSLGEACRVLIGHVDRALAELRW